MISYTWQVMQLSLLQSGHLKLLMLSLMKHHPSQSGVLQWNEFLEVAWTSFNDFCWCFSNTAGDTSYKRIKFVIRTDIYVYGLARFLQRNIEKSLLKIWQILQIVNWMRSAWRKKTIYWGSITLSSKELVLQTCLLTGFFNKKLHSAVFSHANLFISAMTMIKINIEPLNNYSYA